MMSRRSPLLVIALVAALVVPGVAHAQRYVTIADSLLRRGRVFAAETLYYYAARKTPRDPGARLALGRYLAARGALMIGATLMEEALYFGADKKVVATYLAPVYERLGNYKALSTLPSSPLPYAQRTRAEWLAENPPLIEGPDSATVPLAAGDSTSLGEIAIVIGDDTLRAKLDPRAQGVVLDTSWLRRKAIKRFASTYDNDWRNISGVAVDAHVGAYRLTNVPVSFVASGTAFRARMGLDILASMAATIDERAGTIVLRREGRISDDATGERIPTLAYPGGLWLVRRDGVWPLTGTMARGIIGGRRWTLNARRGEVIVD
jgi:hypothetical protein